MESRPQIESPFDMSIYQIRPVCDADGPILARLVADIFAEYPGCHYVAEENRAFEAPGAYYANSAGVLYVIEPAPGRPVGCLGLNPTQDPKTAELVKIYLHQDLRGTGVSAQMLEHGLNTARRAGARRVVLWTDTRFERAHRFYEKNGFKRVPAMRYLADVSLTWEYPYQRELD